MLSESCRLFALAVELLACSCPHLARRRLRLEVKVELTSQKLEFGKQECWDAASQFKNKFQSSFSMPSAMASQSWPSTSPTPASPTSPTPPGFLPPLPPSSS